MLSRSECGQSAIGFDGRFRIDIDRKVDKIRDVAFGTIKVVVRSQGGAVRGRVEVEPSRAESEHCAMSVTRAALYRHAASWPHLPGTREPLDTIQVRDLEKNGVSERRV